MYSSIILTVIIYILWHLGRAFFKEWDFQGRRIFYGEVSLKFANWIWTVLFLGIIWVIWSNTVIGNLILLLYLVSIVICSLAFLKKHWLEIAKARDATMTMHKSKFIRKKVPRPELFFIFTSIISTILLIITFIAIPNGENTNIFNVTISAVTAIILFQGLVAFSRISYYIVPQKITIKKQRKSLKESEYYLQILSSLNFLKLLLRIFDNYVHRELVFRNQYHDTNVLLNNFYHHPEGRNYHFTSFERQEKMLIFRGESHNELTDQELKKIERIYTESNGDNNLTVSLENDDPHIFKIVTWR